MSKIQILLDYDTETGDVTSPTDPGAMSHWIGLGWGLDKFVPPTLELLQDAPGKAIRMDENGFLESVPDNSTVDQRQMAVDVLLRLKDAGYLPEEILEFKKEGLL